MIRRMMIQAAAAALLVALAAFSFQAVTMGQGVAGTAGALLSVLSGGGHDDD
ncbi:hypothetical protein [Azospirillum rugosum]|uniref:Uncharacterized protein n=1 Tax=Azospirillum rugosum TaxID=416170 RepID=A0ABS4SVN9_9PROT|nr:hypothetical protein [Azospirillum rugosum]MBP2295450.1 hypothetical protein [Azospirillum rugosum]MDQ0528329.1 hypothetical protein [Azospirillum rugosum]